MDGATCGYVRAYAPSEVRGELARLGVTKADLDRKGTSVDDLDREVFRMLDEGRGRIADVVREVLGRIDLGSPVSARSTI